MILNQVFLLPAGRLEDMVFLQKDTGMTVKRQLCFESPGPTVLLRIDHSVKCDFLSLHSAELFYLPAGT